MLTVGAMLSAQARLQPHRIGARDLERAMTFAAWNARACRLANALIGLGLDKGARVGVLATNCLEWVEIYAAAAKAGLVAVPVNFRLVAPEVAYILKDCGVSALIVQATFVPVVEEIGDGLAVPPERLVVFGGEAPPGWQGYERLLAAASAREPDTDVSPDDPWCLMYTSGTTGHPKGAIRSHRGIANLALVTGVEFALGRHDDGLLVMPMCHANSLFFFASFLYLGAAVTVYSRASFDAGECLQTIAETGISFTSLVPTHYVMMLDAVGDVRSANGFARVAKLLISSAPARADTKRAVMEMFPNSGLFELYGSTEAGWVTMLRPPEQFDHLGTVGREVVGSAPIRLLDEDGAEVPDGTPGELYSCNSFAFEGYWNLPDKTAQAFAGAYLTVGDMALRDADGFIRLIDRKKNMIITGGENVYPSEVETVLAAHPAVRDVAVVGCPDPTWGERVEAAVVLGGGARVSEADLIAFTHDKLAGSKRPRAIVFLAAEEMPRNATGKILHRVLRARLGGEG